MKFAKELLVDDEEKQNAAPAMTHPPGRPEVIKPSPDVQRPDSSFSQKDRLFQTVNEESGSSRGYLKVLGVIVVLVIVVGIAVSYFTLPGIGDQIRGPRGLEASLREHFQIKEKREATDIEFYQCDGFYWARVHVTKRPDVTANPLSQIETYAAKATPQDNNWNIAATPIDTPEKNVPCR